MLQVESSGQLQTGSGRNGSGAIAGATSEAFARRLHHQYAQSKWHRQENIVLPCDSMLVCKTNTNQNIFGLYVVSFKLWDLTVTKVERLQLMEWTIPINGEGFPFWETGNASFCYHEESCNLSPRNFRGLLRQMSPNLYTIYKKSLPFNIFKHIIAILQSFLERRCDE